MSDSTPAPACAACGHDCASHAPSGVPGRVPCRGTLINGKYSGQCDKGCGRYVASGPAVQGGA